MRGDLATVKCDLQEEIFSVGQKINDHSVVVVTKDQVSADLSGEAAILNLKSGIYYGLDNVGARIWTLVQ